MNTCRHNNKNYNLNVASYTKEENFLNEFIAKGYVFLENVVNLDYDYKSRSEYSRIKSMNIIENFFPDNPEYFQIYNSFKKSKIFNILQDNLTNLRLYNFMCFRLYKGNECSSLHRDDDFAITYTLKTPFVICWMPLTDISIAAGPLAIAGKTETKYTQHDIQEGEKYVQKYLKNDNAMENIDSVRNAMLKEEDYKISAHRDFDTLISRNLKKGDVVVMNHDIVHGSLDNSNLIRSSIDLRLFYNCDPTNKLLKKASLEA
jgi:ectoine hydroxylase-related dioxygenase (phytanoyl-CoA dioxygenase family)